MRLQSILLLSFLTLAACRHDVEVKPDPTPTPTPSPAPTPTPAPTFGLSGDTAIEVMQGRTVDATLFLTDSGAGLPQHFDVSGLPPNVGGFVTRTLATPPNQAILRITAGPRWGLPGAPVAPTGTSIATVRGRLAGGTEKTHSIRVTVVVNPNCAEVMTGTYHGRTCGGQGGDIYVKTDTTVPFPRVTFSNFVANGTQGYADLNCATNTLVFPFQQYGGLLRKFSGTGTFSRDTIRGNLVIYGDASGVVVDSCEFVIGR